MSQEIYLKPCPFCGESGPEISEGSTHRWMQISCCGEVRKADIMLPASHPVNMKLAAEVWNTRAAEASAWVPIRSAEDLPKGTPRFYIWQSKYNPNRMHVEARCSESPVMVQQTLDNYIAWRELPSPYTADSGKEKG